MVLSPILNSVRYLDPVPFSHRIPDILPIAISGRIPVAESDKGAFLDFITCSFNCSSPGLIPLSVQIDPLM